MSDRHVVRASLAWQGESEECIEYIRNTEKLYYIPGRGNPKRTSLGIPTARRATVCLVLYSTKPLDPKWKCPLTFTPPFEVRRPDAVTILVWGPGERKR